jgi:hypothetical protein
VHRIGIADLGVLLAADANSGAIPLLAFGIVAVNLHQLRVIDLMSKGTCPRSAFVASASVIFKLNPSASFDARARSEDSGRRDFVPIMTNYWDYFRFSLRHFIAFW